MALASFYGGPVWTAYRDAANSTMLDSDNVLLLKPARPEFSFQLSRASENEGVATCVLAGTYQLPQPVAAEVISDFERQVVPVLKVNRYVLKAFSLRSPVRIHSQSCQCAKASRYLSGSAVLPPTNGPNQLLLASSAS